MIDIAITDYLNVNTKETEKLYKYKYLEIVVKGMWKGHKLCQLYLEH